ncbi:calcium-dependent phosphotriesterase [Basidiobolus meristosporus CBS 931.73]|uniref:Calcium-dependent phosphotriesterase n=1 Tax=Basidiobolus meristosporus CBS 931.73 TaxID=1314790 RepID=A0A1Y1Y4T8_9FUNG|nr:calcium-dependent phosphotriesterase [Basidiobolus meristosporus CBS 931.73]|eukprot:ORX93007.1 calcium-dependent phosphotriesterase [Basidiobolus meristosporus CBS 931.73]
MLLYIFVGLLAVLGGVLYAPLIEVWEVSGLNKPFPTHEIPSNCVILKELQACEDIHIHHSTATAFLTCGSPQRRTQWYPPIQKMDKAGAGVDQFVKYDLATDTYQALKVVNYPHTELVLHGIGMHENPENPKELIIAAVNHRTSGSVIEIFTHPVGSDKLVHVETVVHELIHSPNDIVVLSKKEFYVTNDFPAMIPKWARAIEMLAPPYTSVIHRSESGEIRNVAMLRGANGIAVNHDASLIYVNSYGTGRLNVYQRSANSGNLVLMDVVKVGFGIDNPTVDYTTGEIYDTGTTNGLAAVKSYSTVGYQVPFQVSKIVNNTDSDLFYGVRFKSNPFLTGIAPGMATVAAVDSKLGKALVGGFNMQGTLLCKI